MITQEELYFSLSLLGRMIKLNAPAVLGIFMITKNFYRANSFCANDGSTAIPGPIVGAIAMLLT